jgi:hypothetical protein
VIYRGLLTTILERGQEKKLFAHTVRPAEDATLIMATLNGVLVQQLVEQVDNIKAQTLLVRLKQTMRIQLCQPPVTRGIVETEAADHLRKQAALLRTGS